jgi:hypothetical protein
VLSRPVQPFFLGSLSEGAKTHSQSVDDQGAPYLSNRICVRGSPAMDQSFQAGLIRVASDR